MVKNQLVIDVAALKIRPGIKKNFKKSEKNACFMRGTSVLYEYMIKKKTLKERIELAKKRNYLTLLDILDILLTNQKKGLI